MKIFPRMNMLMILLSATIICSISGCKKSNSGNSGNPNVWNYGSLSANLGGSNWTAKSVYAVDSSNMVVIVATNDNSGNGYPMILIAFPNNTSEGSTVDFDISNYSMLQFVENTTSAYWAEPALGGSGSVKITKFNKGSKRVEGTFSGVAKATNQGGGSKTISNGNFAINFR